MHRIQCSLFLTFKMNSQVSSARRKRTPLSSSTSDGIAKDFNEMTKNGLRKDMSGEFYRIWARSVLKLILEMKLLLKVYFECNIILDHGKHIVQGKILGEVMKYSKERQVSSPMVLHIICRIGCSTSLLILDWRLHMNY